MDMKTKLGIGGAMLGAFALGVTAVTMSVAEPAADNGPSGSAQTSFSAQEEEEIRALVHQYLMDNPRVIIDAVNQFALEQEMMAQERSTDAARTHLAALLDPAHGVSTGQTREKAKVAVIELYDYHCGFCKRAAPVVERLAKKEKDVHFVFREYPIFGEKSDYASEMALAAREQGKFLEVHYAMMAAKGDLNANAIKTIAKKHGIDFAALEAARENPAIGEAISATHAIARDMMIEGTPAFIVASLETDYIDVVPGFDPDHLQASIKAARRGDATPPERRRRR